MNWKPWLQTVIAAAIGGAATAAVQVQSTGQKVNWSTVGVGALIGVAGLWVRKPTEPPAPPKSNA